MNAHDLGKLLLTLPKTTEVGIPETNKIKVCVVSSKQVVICDKQNDSFIKELKLKNGI